MQLCMTVLPWVTNFLWKTTSWQKLGRKPNRKRVLCRPNSLKTYFCVVYRNTGSQTKTYSLVSRWGWIYFSNFVVQVSRFRAFRESNYKFYFMALIWLIFTWRLKDISNVIFSVMFFAYFVFLKFFNSVLFINSLFNPLSANFTRWSNTLKQFVGKLPTNCLGVTISWVWQLKS